MRKQYIHTFTKSNSKMAYFIDIYFTGYTGDKLSSPNLQIRLSTYNLRGFTAYTNDPAWDQYELFVGRRAYSAIKKWLLFLGGRPVVSSSGSVSDYCYNLDYSQLNLMLDMCKREMDIK